MATDPIWTRLQRIFRRHFLLNPAALLRERRLQDLGLTPLERLELLLYVENAFSIRLNDRDAYQIQTVDDVVRCVESHLRA